MRGAAGQLGLLLVLVVRVLLGPGDDVGEEEDAHHQVLEGLEAAGVNVLQWVQGVGGTML